MRGFFLPTCHHLSLLPPTCHYLYLPLPAAACHYLPLSHYLQVPVTTCYFLPLPLPATTCHCLQLPANVYHYLFLSDHQLLPLLAITCKYLPIPRPFRSDCIGWNYTTDQDAKPTLIGSSWKTLSDKEYLLFGLFFETLVFGQRHLPKMSKKKWQKRYEFSSS